MSAVIIQFIIATKFVTVEVCLDPQVASLTEVITFSNFLFV